MEKNTLTNMSFETDKQTLEELNLPGKFRQGSVYHLFNHTKTRGGEQELDKMFNQPLMDEQLINNRIAIFRFFQEQQLTFPFDPKQVMLMREYLDMDTGSNPVFALAGIFIKKGLATLTRDVHFKKIMQGLQATIITLHKCQAFVATMQKQMGPYSSRIAAIQQILLDKRIERLYNTDIYRPIPVKTLANYDYLLKRRLHQQMQVILSFIFETDLYITVSDVARSRGFVYAQALSRNENVLEASNLSHPCIDKAVGNDIRLGRNCNVLFLTGANMAGKSTFMKSIGISLYLAHIGFPVAASRMIFSVREGLYSSINVADNIGLGYSHFYAEVIRVKQAAKAAATGKSLLLMFDELFKGTNVKDAYDGTLAVTEGFADYKECLFIVSTHIIEVAEALKPLDNIRFMYMPTIMDGNRPKYTYRLQEGITEDRQGMLIIRNEGILDMLYGN